MSTIRDLCSAQLMTTIYNKIQNTNHSFTILMYHSTYRLRGPLPQFARPASSSIIIVRGQRLLPSPMPLVQQQQEQEQWGWLWRWQGGGDRMVFIRINAQHVAPAYPPPTTANQTMVCNEYSIPDDVPVAGMVLATAG
jgi:hypothetical protein